MRQTIRTTRSVMAAVLTLAAAGCGAPLHKALLPETRPEVRLTLARLAAASPATYAVRASWTASSPASPISHYLYAIDPASIDAVDVSWVRTTDTQLTLSFPANSADAASGSSPRGSSHVFAIVAVDERGGQSAARTLAFTQDNLPPVVTITNPPPNSSFALNLPTPARFSWDGVDPDGQSTTKPVRYTYRIFEEENPDFPQIPNFILFAQLNPDSMRKLYEPDFPGWTSVPGETTSAVFRLPVDYEQYLFVITGFDEAGDYDPVFSMDRNMLRFQVAPVGTGSPLIRMFNESFDYTYPYGGWLNDPSRYFKVEHPAGVPITINWAAFPQPASDIRSYRWVLDPYDLLDETPRTDEATDVHHWSAKSLTVTSATIGPFAPRPRQPYLFYIDAEDNLGARSLGIVSLFTFEATTTPKDLLIVDDTRMAPDQQPSPGGPIDQPVGPWPMAAELDTFLFARGNVPWRARPPGSMSSPGIFNGYAYDTLGTRSLLGDVSPSVLSKYRHIVWYVDPIGASYTNTPTDPVSPISALRLMSSPGRMSSLAAYVSQGGKAWLLGGGGAFATLAPYNNFNNGNHTFSREFNELREGRFMYDFAHWREEITILPATRANKFAPGNLYGQGDNRPGRGWPSNPVPPTPPAPPDYSILPLNLNPKNGVDDPAPPGRKDPFTGLPDPNYYVGNYTAEYISQPSYVFEDYDDSANEELYSTMDTLYLTRGGTATRDRPVMTYYHGRECGPFVFSGFSIWYWRRPDCIALVDFVLGSVWGLQRDPGAPRGPARATLARRGNQ